MRTSTSTPGAASCSSTTIQHLPTGLRLYATRPTREELLLRLRQAKAQELPAGEPTGKTFWQDRRTWLLLVSGIGASGWAYSLLSGASVTDRVFMDVDIGGQRAGRIVFGLHGNAVPRATLNFVELATHRYGYGYRGCAFYEVMPRFAVIGGDITKNDGTGGAAALGPSFPKEKSPLKHGRGTLSMVADDDASVRSQFFVCCAAAPSLNSQMVPFGTVLDGMDVVDRIAALPTDGATNRPLSSVLVTDCGELAGHGGETAPGLVDQALEWALRSGRKGG